MDRIETIFVSDIINNHPKRWQRKINILFCDHWGEFHELFQSYEGIKIPYIGEDNRNREITLTKES